jgi:CRISPR-associated protein Cmr2
LADALQALAKKIGDPNPYLAVLVADGDRVGEAISRLGSAGENRGFSQDLSRFAAEARAIIDRHQGILVYAGGDDVLAFVSVDRCLECARKLHDAFGKLLASWSARTGRQPTLSVGVAIAHFLENLEDLLEYGRAAEEHAKDPLEDDRQPDGEHGVQEDRDGLAIHLLKRGGTPIVMRSSWSDDPDVRINELAEWLNAGEVPGGLAYELHALADVYENWPVESVTAAICGEVLHVIASKEPRDKGGAALGRLRTLVKKRVTDAASLRRFADELLVARQLAVGLRQTSSRRDAEGARP